MPSQTDSAGVPSDTTFRGYSSGQVEEYARRRGGYPPQLINEIVKLHASTGGAFGSILDLGCGPGSATRDLAVHFDYAFGLDPSNEMVRTASALGGQAQLAPIYFLQGDAEVCNGIPDHSIDLITAATSGHWFDMERFWPTAARILKPGGTVAFFTIWRIYVHPTLTPHADEVQKILIELEQGTLGPYQKAGNWSLMGLYNDLRMPWSISTPCNDFPESSYSRQVWNPNGMPEPDGSYVCGEKVMTLDEAEQAIATISAVTRWREAHPKLAHTDKDCVVAAFKQIKSILDAGPDDKITMVGPTVLVTLKRG
jgi:SAM-dependent methyltransferase